MTERSGLDTDELLASGLKNGDREAAETLVDRYHGRIYRYMRHLGHSHQMSDELTQQTFVQAWSKIGQLTSGASLRGWLYRIAHNMSAQHIRRIKQRNEVDISECDLSQMAATIPDQVELDEELARLRRAIDALPHKLEQAVVLHYLEQLTIAEAAEAIGIRTGTFKSRLSRGLKALCQELDLAQGD